MSKAMPKTRRRNRRSTAPVLDRSVADWYRAMLGAQTPSPAGVPSFEDYLSYAAP